MFIFLYLCEWYLLTERVLAQPMLWIAHVSYDVWTFILFDLDFLWIAFLVVYQTTTATIQTFWSRKIWASKQAHMVWFYVWTWNRRLGVHMPTDWHEMRFLPCTRLLALSRTYIVHTKAFYWFIFNIMNFWVINMNFISSFRYEISQWYINCCTGCFSALVGCNLCAYNIVKDFTSFMPQSHVPEDGKQTKNAAKHRHTNTYS